MKRLVVVDVSVGIIFHTALIGSIYLDLAGHNQPGGGFVGGLVAGAAIALRYVAGGIDDVRSLLPWKPWTILGAGVLVAAVTATIPLLLGEAVLTSAKATVDAPLLGTINITSATAFDIGVYLVVVGVVLMAFEAFGGEPDGQA